MTASKIAARRFPPAVDGYDRKEVHAFLIRVGQHIARLHGQIEGQRARIQRLEAQLGVGQKDAYERLSREVGAVLAAAEEAAERIRQEAEDEAGAILSRARRTREAAAGGARGVPDGAAAVVATKASVETELDALHTQLGSLASMMREIHLPADGSRLEPWKRHDIEEAELAADGRGGAPAT